MTHGSKQVRISLDEALAQLRVALGAGTRGEIVDAAMEGADVPASLAHLRKAMRSHEFRTTSGTVSLRRMVDTLDARTKREGMHVLQGWDFVAHQFPKDIAPVLLLDYCARIGIPAERQRPALAILLDQYFLALLSLLAVRAWDEGDPNENLDRVTAALTDLQGPDGSGHRFVDDAETLLMLAVSYYHPEEHGYDLLVQRVATLDAPHQLAFARACAALLGGHLRWGLRFMYGRDVGRMREDNVADYPLLLFAVLTLMRALEHANTERDSAMEALLSGLSSDPWAFADQRLSAFPAHDAWYAEFRERFEQERSAILVEFERFQPSPRAFSPLSFSCNFPTNATVAMVALAVQSADAHPPLNALFVRESDSTPAELSAHRLAERLMKFAASDPDRLGAGGAPLLVYDPFDGAHRFNTTLKTLSAAT